MATKTVVCPECGDPVTYGRLSCPACGSLLASVAGGPVRVASEPDPVVEESAAPVDTPVRMADVAAVPLPPAARRAGAAASRAASGGASAVRAAAATARATAAAVRSAATGPDTAESETPSLPPAAETNGHVAMPAARPATRRRAAARAAETSVPAVPPVLGEWPVSASSFDDGPASDRPATADDNAAASAVPRRGSFSPPLPERAATLSAALSAPLGMHPAEAGAAPAWPSQPAGAYLPPSAVFVTRAPGGQAASAIRARQVAPASPPPGWRDGVAWPGDPAEPVETAQQAAAGSAPLLADLPFDVPTTIAGWLIAAGAGVAAVSFLLPWSSNVIGAKGIGTYLDSWGLASPPSFIVFAVTLAVLALAVVPNDVPVWLRTGMAGLLLGGLLVGLVWPYVIGGWADGAQVGVLGELAAAIMLIAGGTLTQRPPRHEGEPAPV